MFDIHNGWSLICSFPVTGVVVTYVGDVGRASADQTLPASHAIVRGSHQLRQQSKYNMEGKPHFWTTVTVCAKNFSGHWPFGLVANSDQLAQTRSC